ncbi:hypothetical protein DFJ73DRAFT_797570 [Zopfochytrium polystomum]|nr:hypothetical protein DFJ73DRAFT_797570 [Zopfochytrium polystomum]
MSAAGGGVLDDGGGGGGDYLSSAWIDFRVTLDGPSEDRAVLRALHVATFVFVPPVVAYASYILWLKVIAPRSWPFRVTEDNRLLPRANELCIVMILLFLVFRWLHILVLVADLFPSSFAAREFTHDLPFACAYFLSCMWTLNMAFQGRPMGRPHAYPAVALGLAYFASVCLAAGGPVLGILTGAAADAGDFSRAAFLVSLHFYYWTVLIAINVVLATLAGVRLRARIADNIAIARGRGIDLGLAGRGGGFGAPATVQGGDPAGIAQTLEISLEWMMAMLYLHNVGAVAYACLTALEGSQHVRIHATLWSQYALCAVWLFTLPVVAVFIYLATHISHIKSVKLERSRLDSSDSSTTSNPSSGIAAAGPAASFSRKPSHTKKHRHQPHSNSPVYHHPQLAAPPPETGPPLAPTSFYAAASPAAFTRANSVSSASSASALALYPAAAPTMPPPPHAVSPLPAATTTATAVAATASLPRRAAPATSAHHHHSAATDPSAAWWMQPAPAVATAAYPPDSALPPAPHPFAYPAAASGAPFQYPPLQQPQAPPQHQTVYF